MRASDFSLRALYAALDAERRARGLSWAAATREMNGRAERVSAGRHQMSASTVKGVGKRTVAEGDGVLAMLRWLKRTPESFVQGHADGARLPEVPAGKVLRFDTKRMHAALEAQRVARGMIWEEVAKEVGLGVSSLKYLANGGRTAFPQVMRIVRWLGRPATEFTRMSDW